MTTPGRDMAQFSQKVIMGAPFETTERYANDRILNIIDPSKCSDLLIEVKIYRLSPNRNGCFRISLV